MQPRPIGLTVNGPSLRFADHGRFPAGAARRGIGNRAEWPSVSRRETWPTSSPCAVSLQPVLDRRHLGENADGRISPSEGRAAASSRRPIMVADIRAAIAYWIRDCKVGPWFLLDHFTGEHPVYRGAPSQADVAIAMAFAGHMQIELIQPNDDHPSVYRETIERARLRLPPFRPRQRRYRGGHRRARGARLQRSPSAPACRPAATSPIWTAARTIPASSS